MEELRELASRKETLIFYEAPHRIEKTLYSLFTIFGDRKACIARELTKKHEEFIRGGLKELSEIDPTTLKGEMVIVVEGSLGEIKPDLNETSNNDVKEEVKAMGYEPVVTPYKFTKCEYKDYSLKVDGKDCEPQFGATLEKGIRSIGSLLIFNDEALSIDVNNIK